MIRSLRRKFILIAMLSLLGTMAALCAAIAVGNHFAAVSRADRAIELLYQNGGEFPDPQPDADPAMGSGFQITEETPFETRYFMIKLTARQEVAWVDTEHIAALNRQTVLNCVSEIVEGGKERGYVDYYRFGVFQRGDGGSTIIVLDCFLQFQSFYNMVRLMAFVCLACALGVFVLLWALSRRVIRPFVENLERQKQFVTDASHELKTPLAILSADLGLIEDSRGRSEWLDSANAQVARLDKLIHNLVELARTEESIQDEAVAAFDLSEVASACAQAFQPLAESAGKTLTARIAPGIVFRGVRDNLFRLFSILLDNAVKYCDSGGAICLSLSQRGRGVCLCVSNPCAGLDSAQLPRYFDRFYRADSSRARATGGYGIGLSTAKAIVERHRGRITDHYADGVITFTVVLPQSARKGSGEAENWTAQSARRSFWDRL